jgi:hypothetical protein
MVVLAKLNGLNYLGLGMVRVVDSERGLVVSILA